MEALDRRLATLRKIDPAVPVESGESGMSGRRMHSPGDGESEGDPGHQGWHGLKENVTDDFICLGAPKDGHNETLYTREEGGSRYYLWTAASPATNVSAEARIGGLAPDAIYVNGSRVTPRGTIPLSPAPNPLLLRYNEPGRGHFVLERAGAIQSPVRTPLAMSWYDRPE